MQSDRIFPEIVFPLARVYLVQLRSSMSCAKKGDAVVGSFMIFVFFETKDKSKEMNPKVGTLPASQWTTRPFGKALYFLIGSPSDEKQFNTCRDPRSEISNMAWSWPD